MFEKWPKRKTKYCFTEGLGFVSRFQMAIQSYVSRLYKIFNYQVLIKLFGPAVMNIDDSKYWAYKGPQIS